MIEKLSDRLLRMRNFVNSELDRNHSRDMLMEMAIDEVIDWINSYEKRKEEAADILLAVKKEENN
jgi:NTP pyrophosphatase (non-canonical NTP hydrolase)